MKTFAEALAWHERAKALSASSSPSFQYTQAILDHYEAILMNQREIENKQGEVAGKLREMRDAQFKLSDHILHRQPLEEARTLGEKVKTLTDEALKAYTELVT